MTVSPTARQLQVALAGFFGSEIELSGKELQSAMAACDAAEIVSLTQLQVTILNSVRTRGVACGLLF